MSKMKFSLIAAMLIMVMAASAQVNLGIKGGVNMSNFLADELNDKGIKIGFNVGLSADFDFSSNSALQTGLFLTTKGAKYSASFGSVSADYTVNPIYLQLPVHYAYKIDVTPGTRIVFHAGPYAAYGVAGKMKLKGSVGDYSGEKDEKLFGDDKSLKPFDAGLGLGAGVELGSIVLDLGWDMGLVNISNTSHGDIKNQNAYLSVGYKF